MLAVEYARVFRPRWLVLENVIHMRPWSRYGELKRELEGLGYNLCEQVLNASDYGVAQMRRRLFLIGDRKQEPNVKTPVRRGRRRSVKSILDPQEHGQHPDSLSTVEPRELLSAQIGPLMLWEGTPDFCSCTTEATAAAAGNHWIGRCALLRLLIDLRLLNQTMVRQQCECFRSPSSSAQWAFWILTNYQPIAQGSCSAAGKRRVPAGNGGCGVRAYFGRGQIVIVQPFEELGAPPS